MTNRDLDFYEKLQEQKAYIEEQGYKVAYIAIYGSQNYNLDIYTEDYKSDIDMKALVIPDLDDLVYDTKPVSKTLQLEGKYAEQCDLKDIRKFFEIFVKGNPAYLEIFFTDYAIIDSEYKEYIDEIDDRVDDLVYAVRGQLIRAIFGMAKQKHHALTHKYPSKEDIIDEYGYDPKQIHHILRLLFMAQDYFISNKSFKESLIPTKSQKERLLDLKLNKYPLEEIKNLAEKYIDSLERIRTDVLDNLEENKIDYSAKYDIIDIGREIVKHSIIEDIKEEYYG